ncbi:hypothetical protein ACJX0J_027173, partial [Zea mays]
KQESLHMVKRSTCDGTCCSFTLYTSIQIVIDDTGDFVTDMIPCMTLSWTLGMLEECDDTRMHMYISICFLVGYKEIYHVESFILGIS